MNVNIAIGDNHGEVFVEVTQKNRKVYRITDVVWSENGKRFKRKTAVEGRGKDKSTAFVDLKDVDTGQAVELHIRYDQFWCENNLIKR